MLRLRPSDHHGLADLLGELPNGFRAVEAGPGCLVIGPTGAFLVGEGGRDPRPVARHLSQWATRFRAAVAGMISWAPFVDVLVVADPTRVTLESASVVAPDMLVDTLVSGPTLLTAEAVDELTGLAGRVVAAADSPCASR